jgi:hypothetical protein
LFSARFCWLFTSLRGRGHWSRRCWSRRHWSFRDARDALARNFDAAECRVIERDSGVGLADDLAAKDVASDKPNLVAIRECEGRACEREQHARSEF